MTTHHVIVVGGGASGLMAAGQAAELGAKTLLLEKMDRPGCKLRLTGGGRCNLTNHASLPHFLAHFGPSREFLRQAFSRFFSDDLITFFEGIGVRTLTAPDGKVFPASERAEDVVDALVRWNDRVGVERRLQSPVQRLLLDNGRLTGVAAGPDSSSCVCPADAVIIATGGASYPSTGSTGDGYRLAASAGHTLVPIRPALVALETADAIAPRLQGIALSTVSIRLWVNGERQSQATGDMIFTHFGVSGPPILSLSRQVVDALRLDRTVALSVDLCPGLDQCALDARLRRDFAAHGRRRVHTVLDGLLPEKLAILCVDRTGIPPDRPASHVTSPERKHLLTGLKDFRIRVTGHRPIAEAIVTAGGVDTCEVDPRTMASRLVAGLYFAGEMLDIDADTGGYNLQAAFSTGWLAGRSAAAQAQTPTKPLAALRKKKPKVAQQQKEEIQ